MKIGIDLGGTKIEGIVITDDGEVVWKKRVDTPRHDYRETVEAVRGLSLAGEMETSSSCTVGVGIPGSIVATTGLAQNANSTWLNGKPFAHDLSEALDREVRVANDANCFALSESVDGAAAGARGVWGIIVGTGCGGGLIRDGKIINGPLGIGGEWGHMPLPWPQAEEFPGPVCWCGRRGCMENWISGPAMERDHEEATGTAMKGKEIYANRDDDPACLATLNRHMSRMARGMAVVINIFDPDVIVIGGGLSNMDHLYEGLPNAVLPHIFTSNPAVDIRKPKFGDSSGVRGAAWLWG